MKRILKYNLLFIALLLISACNDDYIDITDPNNITEDSYYKTAEHAQAAITSCYDPLKHPATFNEKFYFYFEPMGGHSVHEQVNVNNAQFNSSTQNILYIWIHLYKGIYRCNLALEKIPPIEMDEKLKERYIAEAKFLRAFFNFYTVLIFNEPILQLEVPQDPNADFGNADKEEIYKAIERDLLDAIDVLPSNYDDNPENLGRATKGAAQAMLGKHYLYIQNFEQARKYLNDVKTSNEYSLITPKGTDSVDYVYAYLCNFTENGLTHGNNSYPGENNDESIFEIQFETGGWELWEGGWQADGKLTTMYFGPGGWKNVLPTQEYVNKFESGLSSEHPAGLHYDPRRSATIYSPGDTILFTDGSIKIWKTFLHQHAFGEGYGYKKYFYPHYKNGPELKNDPNNQRLIRYSDVLLMLAEADYMVNGGTSQLAIDCINEVRNRVGVPEIDEVSPEVIMHERDVEFGFEFSRFHDLLRWSQYPTPWVNISQELDYFIKGKHEYMPIPQYEIDINSPKLKQNPGY